MFCYLSVTLSEAQTRSNFRTEPLVLSPRPGMLGNVEGRKEAGHQWSFASLALLVGCCYNKIYLKKTKVLVTFSQTDGTEPQKEKQHRIKAGGPQRKAELHFTT